MLKRILKTVSLFLCALFLLSACGKAPQTEENPTDITENMITEANPESVKGKIALPFNSADGLNPFFAKSDENRLLFSFLYEPLFEPDSSYNPVSVIAESIVISGGSATVKIKSGVSCRGSSNITASDVVYSFHLAKASYLYSGELTSVLSAAAKSGNTVEFTLKSPDVFAAGKLCFPIVKEGTADIQTAAPTGSGKYYFLENRLVSVADKSRVIELCTVDTRDSVRNAFKIGSCDFFFSDLSDCNYTGVSGRTEDVPLNNMVYIGLNSGNGALNKYVRSAVAAKLNSEDIAVSSYQGHAVASKLPFNPASHFAKDAASVALKGDDSLAAGILDRSGFTKTVNGVRTNGAYYLSFKLLVNNENRFRLSAAYAVADSLNKTGFRVTVEAVPFAEYSERIQSGGFDMYLGEIKLDGSMDIGIFWEEGSPFSSGIDRTERAATEYARYRAGEMSSAEYSEIFAEFYPFVPVCFRTGYIVSSDDIALDLSRAPYNLYYNID